MILSILSQYARKDQITITATAIAFYFMEFPELIRRSRFRQLVALFGISLGYDIAWFLLNRDVDDEDSGGIEVNIRKFSRYISYVSFIWRILVCILLEKASLDFIGIVKGKKHNLKNAESLDYKVQ